MRSAPGKRVPPDESELIVVQSDLTALLPLVILTMIIV
jgi:hypothetical protein